MILNSVWYLLFGGIIYIILCVFVAIEGKSRKVGFFRTFLSSLLLTPIFGYYMVNKYKPKIIASTKKYICARCKRTFSNKYKYCPICVSKGNYIKIKTID